jgi:signal transduction histidine kinase
LTGALGLLVSRSLTVPIHQLKISARALQEGRYQEPVGNFGRDELGELAQAFGHMSREIRRRDEEIRAWNADLQRRVEEKSEELKAAQDQILRARRLAAMGSLGAGVAHEINNPLMAIAGFVALLERDGIGKQLPTLKKAQEQVQRVARIVEGMLQFTTQERAVQGRKFALAAPVRSVLQKYAPQLDQTGIELSAELDAPVREAEGDPVQIEQVVEHLVRNAIQAMPRGGKLHVSVAAVGGDSLKLVVADTGRGIAPGVRDRIFDPFFSTKDGGKGAGLGLSISHSIVEAHHGRILVDSVEGRGATFTVVLPAAAAPAHLS